MHMFCNYFNGYHTFYSGHSTYYKFVRAATFVKVIFSFPIKLGSISRPELSGVNFALKLLEIKEITSPLPEIS